MAVEYIEDIFEGIEEELIPKRNDPPIGTYDVELQSDISWRRISGTNERGDWVMNFIHLHVAALATVKGALATGRHFFPEIKYDRNDTRTQTDVKGLADGLGMDSIRGLLPTYVPADASSPYDGGVVEGTKGMRARVTVTQGRPRVNKDDDSVRPGRFYFRFEPIPEDSELS